MHTCSHAPSGGQLKVEVIDLPPPSGDRFKSKPLRSLNQFKNRTEVASSCPAADGDRFGRERIQGLENQGKQLLRYRRRW